MIGYAPAKKIASTFRIGRRMFLCGDNSALISSQAEQSSTISEDVSFATPIAISFPALINPLSANDIGT